MNNIPPNERLAWAREDHRADQPEFDAIGTHQLPDASPRELPEVQSTTRQQADPRIGYYSRRHAFHWGKGWMWFAMMAGAIWLFAGDGHFPWWMLWFAWPIFGFLRRAGWRGGLALIVLGGILFARLNWELNGPLWLGTILIGVGGYLALSTLFTALRVAPANQTYS